MPENYETNHIQIRGHVARNLAYSHTMFAEKFYSFDMEIPRLSDTTDVLPVTISERLINQEDFYVGSELSIVGQVRSYNRYHEAENRNRLILSVFARDYEVNNDLLEGENKSPNEVFLEGYLCKKPVFRQTPFGREIADLLLAVNRAYNKSDYIPCIAWGRNARFTSELTVGDKLSLKGRMQSRPYQKRVGEDETITRVALEISVATVELLDENNQVNENESIMEGEEMDHPSEG